MTDTKWYKLKMNWVLSIASDPKLQGLPTSLAFVLAWTYINEMNDAWPKNETLATNLNTTERSIRRARTALVNAGKLKCILGGSGVGDTNHYTLTHHEQDIRVLLKEDTPVLLNQNKDDVHVLHNRNKEDTPDRIRGTTPSKKGGRTRPNSPTRVNQLGDPERVQIRRDATNMHRRAKARRRSLDPQEFLSGRLKGELENGGEPILHSDSGDSVPHTYPYSEAHPRDTYSGRRRSFPADWELTNDEIRAAHEVANWDLPKAQIEFNAFRDWALAKGARSPDWHAAWRTWCHKGAEYARRHPSQQRTDEFPGLRAFLEMGNREPTKH